MVYFLKNDCCGGCIGGEENRIPASENGHERRRASTQEMVEEMYQGNLLSQAGRYHALEYLLMGLYGVSGDISEQEMNRTLKEVIKAEEKNLVRVGHIITQDESVVVADILESIFADTSLSKEARKGIFSSFLRLSVELEEMSEEERLEIERHLFE